MLLTPPLLYLNFCIWSSLFKGRYASLWRHEKNRVVHIISWLFIIKYWLLSQQFCSICSILFLSLILANFDRSKTAKMIQSNKSGSESLNIRAHFKGLIWWRVNLRLIWSSLNYAGLKKNTFETMLPFLHLTFCNNRFKVFKNN